MDENQLLDSPTKYDIILENFLYLGNGEAAADFTCLKNNEIRYILNCSRECENSFPNDFTYLHFENLFDWEHADIKQYFESAFKFIEVAREKSFHILVHCSGGVSRSASIVIAYLMKYQSMSLKQAFLFVKDKKTLDRTK